MAELLTWVCTTESMHVFSASKLVALPLNVYQLGVRRRKRNPVNVSSTPVRGFSSPYRKTMICLSCRAEFAEVRRQQPSQ